MVRRLLAGHTYVRRPKRPRAFGLPEDTERATVEHRGWIGIEPEVSRNGDDGSNVGWPQEPDHPSAPRSRRPRPKILQARKNDADDGPRQRPQDRGGFGPLRPCREARRVLEDGRDVPGNKNGGIALTSKKAPS